VFIIKTNCDKNKPLLYKGVYMFRLKQLREQRGLEQYDLAKEFNTTQQTISFWENEKRRPNPDILKKIADYFDVTVDYLIGRTDKAIIEVYTDKEFPLGTLEENSEIHLFKDALKSGLTVEDIKEAIEFMKKLKS
jgi:transcriptional regulator with XRE-family HTH domain